MAVYICPAANDIARKHYDDTVRHLVNFEASPRIWGSALERLRAAHPEGRAAIWGSRRGKRDVHVRKHAMMRAGDTALFYESGKFYAAATVATTFVNAIAGEDLRGLTTKGEAWELMFSLNDATPIDLPGEAVNAAVGYAPNNVHQSFNRLDGGRAEAVLELLQSEFGPLPTPQEFNAALTVLDGPLDFQVSKAARVEQRMLRAALLGGPSVSTGECALCGDAFPATMLVAAHIKPRSVCTLDEKKDIPNIAMLACAFGCDILFERGYVAVDSTGQIQISRTKDMADELAAGLVGRRCGAFTSEREQYFAWHAANRFE